MKLSPIHAKPKIETKATIPAFIIGEFMASASLARVTTKITAATASMKICKKVAIFKALVLPAGVRNSGIKPDATT